MYTYRYDDNPPPGYNEDISNNLNPIYSHTQLMSSTPKGSGYNTLVGGLLNESGNNNILLFSLPLSLINPIYSHTQLMSSTPKGSGYNTLVGGLLNESGNNNN